MPGQPYKEVNMIDADSIIKLLDLKPLDFEGGYFKETYRSEEMLDAGALPGRSMTSKNLSTAIYFLLTPDTVSLMHRLPTDEIFHFYLGDPVDMLILNPDSTSQIVKLGQDIFNGQHVQFIVPAGTWQGASLAEGGKFALMGTTMSPGFNITDFEAGNRSELLGQFPSQARLITNLTKDPDSRV